MSRYQVELNLDQKQVWEKKVSTLLFKKKISKKMRLNFTDQTKEDAQSLFDFNLKVMEF